MNIKLIAFVGCIMVLSVVSGFRGGGYHHDHHHGGHYGHHGHNHWNRHEPVVNFEVHEPKGLTVSMVQRSPKSTLFGIELFINQNPQGYSETHCDVCHNTTTVTYGKFIIKDEVVVIKKGDVLNYRVLLGDSNNVIRLHPTRLWVTDAIISKCNCGETSEDPDIDVRFGQLPQKSYHCRPHFEVKLDLPEGATGNVQFESEVDPVTNLCRTAKSEKLTHPEGSLEREVEMLEEIVEKLGKSYGSRGTTNLLRLEKSDSDSDTNDKEQLTDYIRTLFSVNQEMRQLGNRIRRVLSESGSPRIVLLNMSSYTDKQKVLFHAQRNNLKHISDYDLTS